MNARTRHLLAGLAVVVALPLVPGTTLAHAAADGCAAGMTSDFNGDGFSDAAVADPNATVGGDAAAGRVIVLYGDADGRIGEGARSTVSQDSVGVGDTAEPNDRFGSALAVADLNCDGFSDLVVGTPLEDVSGHGDSGLAQFIYGAAGGLGAGAASRQVTQDDFPNADIVAGDQFGYAVDALEDVGQGGTPNPDAYAVAIGVPGGNIGGHNDSGWVGVLHPYDGGNLETAIHQNSTGVPGTAEAGDRFGAAVAIQHFLTADASHPSFQIDVVVGVPNEDVGSKVDAGAVTLVKDVYDEEFPGSKDLTQDTPGVPGAPEANDLFGSRLDVVRVGGTTRLAVGVPGEDVGSDNSAGSVQLFSSNNITITPGAGLTQDSSGVSGSAEAGDRFGDQVSWIAPGLGDAATRLAVGIPGEDSAAANQGSVQVFPVNDLDGETTWTQDSAGVPGSVDAGDEFGETIASVFGATERALLIGVPDDVDYAAGMVNVIPLGGGAPRAWIPGAGGIPAGASRFAGALGSTPGGSTG